MSILSELIGEIWCRLNVGSGLSVLVERLPMVCFSNQAFEFSTTERELGKLLFFVFSHFCFFRRYAVRTSVLRRTCIMKMKNPCKKMCFVQIQCERSLAIVKGTNKIVFFYLLKTFIQVFKQIGLVLHDKELLYWRERSNCRTLFGQIMVVALYLIRHRFNQTYPKWIRTLRHFTQEAFCPR